MDIFFYIWFHTGETFSLCTKLKTTAVYYMTLTQLWFQLEGAKANIGILSNLMMIIFTTWLGSKKVKSRNTTVNGNFSYFGAL